MNVDGISDFFPEGEYFDSRQQYESDRLGWNARSVYFCSFVIK